MVLFTGLKKKFQHLNRLILTKKLNGKKMATKEEEKKRLRMEGAALIETKNLNK